MNTEMSKTLRPAHVTWPAIWLALCGWLVFTGWTLSVFGWLNRWGYTGAALATLGYLALRHRPWLAGCRHLLRLPPSKRFRRLPALLFFIVFLMTLLGGILYAPSNYDALSYRLPRMLHWISEGGWHWIHTNYHPVNTRASATEWISLPFILFSSSDRLLFLVNIISFALLPGLTFGILTRLGIRRRVAIQWMWIFPSGYCFALQAGGIGNDLPGAVLFLGGVHFALRARNSRAWGDFALACLGMALATGAKSSNVPLGLPWLLCILPAIPLAWQFPVRSALLAPVLVMASFLPNAVLNHKYCGDWTGLKAEPVLMRGGDPVLYVSWNSLYAVVHNLTPPILPFNEAYNREVRKLIPGGLKERLKENFEPAAANLYMTDLMMEEAGPLGLGVGCLLVLGAIGGRMNRRDLNPAHTRKMPTHKLLWACAFASLLALFVMFSKSGLSGIGRYMAPYYLLLVSPFLTSPGLPAFLKSRIWKSAVILSFAALMPTIMLNAARPLWPALTILDKIKGHGHSHPILNRADDVYSGYRTRPETLVPLARLLPESAKHVGLLSGNTPETSLWKPFGSRKVSHILSTDTLDSIRASGIEYVVAGKRTMSENGFPPFEEWQSQTGATIVGEVQITVLVRYGQESWYVLRIPPAD